MTTDVEQQESSLSEDLATNLVMDESPEEAAEPEAVQEAVQEAIEALEPAPKWDKRYKEVFSAWGEAAEDGNPLYPNGRDWQQAMLDLYNEGQGYTTQVEQERAEVRKQLEQFQQFAHGWNQVIGPYNGLINELGTTPDNFVRQALGLAQSLRNNPRETLMRIAREGNIDLQSALSEQPWQSPESKEIEQLRREMAHMRREEVQRQQRQAAQRAHMLRQQNAAEINAFVEAKDEAGNPLHPHVEAVEGVMAQLIHGREAVRRSNPSMPSMTLEEAYDEACKLSPEIAQEISKQQEVSRLAQQNAEAKKAKEASKRTKAGSTGKNTPEKSLREEIRDAMKQQAA